MKQILKMTDIAPSEVERELGYVRYSAWLAPKVAETQEGVILTCDVTPENRAVYAQVLQALNQYVYTDCEQTAVERVCDLVEVRGLRLVVVEQGTRGQIASALLAEREIDDNLVHVEVVNSVEQLCKRYGVPSERELVLGLLNRYQADAVLLTTAQFEQNPLVPTRAKVVCSMGGVVVSNCYQLLGTRKDIAQSLSFLGTAWLAKKIL